MSTLTEQREIRTLSVGSYSPVPRIHALKTLWTVAERELLEQLTSLRFMVVALLVVLLTPLSVYVGSHDYRIRQDSHQRLLALSTANRSFAKEGNPVLYDRDVMWTPYNDLELFRVLRPPDKLSVLVKGLDGAMPEYWDFSASGLQTGPPASPAFWMGDLLGALDMEFVIRVVLGLLAILIAFDSICGEKEQGTLRLALSHPVSRPVFWMGKMLGGGFTLLVPLTLTMVLALLSAKLMGTELADWNTVAKASGLFLVSAVYLLSLNSLGLFVSSVSKIQKTALVVLLVSWVMLVLAVPPLAILGARAFAQVHTVQWYEAQKRSFNEDLRTEKEKAIGRAFMEVTGSREPGHLKSSDYYDNREILDKRIEKIEVEYTGRQRRFFNQIDQSFERGSKRQSVVASAIMAISPAALFAQLATTLAGTGDLDRESWIEAVRRQQSRLNQFVFDNPSTLNVRDEVSTMSMDRGTTPARLSDVPPFVPPVRNLGSTLDAILFPAALLCVFWGLFVLVGLAAFYRYDVR
jgi:ABC-type transport system involved in multi-copper enzyme maturation permease subunit